MSKSIPDSNGIPCVTSGTQKWNGASPSFIANAIVIINEADVLEICPVIHWFVVDALKIAENKIIIDAVAWIMKYLIADSILRGWWGFVISGIIANVLISSPIQAVNQWLLISVIVVPNNRLKDIIVNT